MIAEALPAPAALRWLIGGEWRAQPARVATAVLAIAVGVALGFAVHLVNASALQSFARGLAQVNGTADLRVEARSARGFDERLYPQLAEAGGIAAASPVVTLDGRIGRTQLDLLGLDMLRVRTVTPGLLARPATGEGLTSLFDPDALFLSPAALQSLKLHPGMSVVVGVGARAARFRVAGTLPGIGAGKLLGVIDIAAAQTRFGRLGRLDRIDLALAPGADETAVRRSLAALLPRDAAIAATADDTRRTDALSRAYRVNLGMLALVALLTGAFLVYSAQALSVARRRPQFALVRVLGATGGAVIAQLVVEGLVLGVAGAALGVAGGYGIAALVLRLVGGDLGSGYFAGAVPPLAASPGGAALFALLGLVAAIAGSLWPAIAAARVQPAIALKNLGDAVDPRRRAPIRPALALAAGGGAAALFPAVNGLPLFGYLAMALLLAAGIAAMPRIARAILAPLARLPFREPAVTLAAARLWGAPSQAAVALSGTVASTALTVAMMVMVSSFRGSVDEWLGQVLPADLYLTLAGGARIDPAAQARLEGVPGIARIAFALQEPLSLRPDRPPLTLVVRPDPARDYPPIGRSRLPASSTIPVWASEPAARLFGLGPGARLLLPIGGARGTPATVAGVWRDYARQDGALALRATDYDRLTGERDRSEAAVSLAAGVDPAHAAASLTRALPPLVRAQTSIVPVAALRARALAIFDRSFAVTYGLEAVALLVGLAGVATTVSAQTFARAREFGMLRHLGVTRRQLVGMLASEGALLGLIGGVAGVALGTVLAQVLIQVINPQSFHWTMQTRLPAPSLLGVVAALLLASAGTAAIAGRRAAAPDAVRAVREDW